MKHRQVEQDRESELRALSLGDQAVLAVLNYVGDSTVEGLISRYNELRLGAQGWAWLPAQSGEAIREQLRRLIRLGLVVDHVRRVDYWLAFGYKTPVWCCC